MIKIGIELILTNMCNLNCRYCYVNKSNPEIISYSDIKSVLNRVLEQNWFDGNVYFFGGEPSICSTLIEVVNRDYGDKCNLFITSNGHFIFNENKNYLLKMFKGVSITLEANEDAYNFYRGESNLSDKIKTLLELDKSDREKITVNISINKKMFENIDETIENYNKIKSGNIKVHLYSIKGDDGYSSPVDFFNDLISLKEKSIDLYNEIVRPGIESDAEFLCTFDNKLSLTPSGKIVGCEALNNECANIENIDSFIDGYKKEISKNHVSLYDQCKNCDLNVGDCQISCPSYINDLIKNKRFDELDLKCSMERVKNYLRKMEE